MLEIKNITIKNFLSVGAQTQAINFEGGDLTLVLGQNVDVGNGEGSRNGTGKSALIQALSYGLYGDAITNIRKDNLINLTNRKNMLVSVEFSVAGMDYRIERGRRPIVLKLFVNNQEILEDQAQGDSRETQKEIEKIIGFPHNMFKHLIALNTYTEPFLSMRANDQREMIEQLLGITDLSAKADLLKELLRDTKDQIRQEEISIDATEKSNQRIEKNIKEIQRKARAWDISHKERIQDLVSSIKVMKEINIEQEITCHKQNQVYQEYANDLAICEKDLKNLTQSHSRADTRLTSLQEDLDSALAGQCPSCGQGTAHLDTHETYIHELRDKISQEQMLVDDLHREMLETRQKMSQMTVPPGPHGTFYQDVETAYAHKHNMEALENQLQDQQQQQNPYTEQVTSLTESGLQPINWDIMNSLVETRDHQDFLLKLLTNKDSFIRKRIIDQNIAYLNSRLRHYLEKIGLPHEVKFSSDLSVEITEFGRELDFFNLSRGESNRLILSLSWAFRDVYESLHRPMNLMFVDELIDSGMDTMGVENALSVLKHMQRQNRRSIYLISHREELIGRVNSVLMVSKTAGFTEYAANVDVLA